MGQINDIEDVDATIENLVRQLRGERDDLAVSVERVHEKAVEYAGVSAEEIDDEVHFAFKEDDDETTFAIGLFVGVLLDKREEMVEERNDEE